MARPISGLNSLAAFHYALVAYLASFSTRLAQMTPDQFVHWLDAVDSGGSVLGLAI